MNLSTLSGFIVSIAVFGLAVMMSAKNMMIFLDWHAILIVIGGTMAVSLICFPLEKLNSLLRVFLKRMLGANKRAHIGLVSEITAVAQAHRKGRAAFEAAIPRIGDLFLKDAAQTLSWADVDVPVDSMRQLLELRANTHFTSYMDEANIFRTMSKFPPAFGLMGTTLGMIALLQSLGAADARTSIGPSMAIGLVATLYGIAISNFIFIPIGENLSKQTREDHVARKMVIECIMLIHAGMPVKFVEETAKSYLLPGERAKLNSAGSGGAARAAKA